VPERSHFAVWAPRPSRVRLWTREVGSPAGAPVPEPSVTEMVRGAGDWWAPADGVPDGELDYGYLLDDDPTPRPDPRSRRQPAGVHGPSRTFDPARFRWTDGAWTGRGLAGSVIYELHVGTFTPGGTLDSAIGKLGHLVDLGIDTVELLPVAAFNGPHGWGYDGVDWFCVHEPYGGPRAYQRFVDACHARGLAVVQDVVYNHWGPSGNYLPLFGPYQDDLRDTPWGQPVNLDGPDSDEVRSYIIDNALMWLEDFHVDGLRLDAVHALDDPGQAYDILEALSSAADAVAPHLRRPVSLVAESDQNNPRLIRPREAGGYGLAGLWSDDFHHALIATLTGDGSGYLADFVSPDALAKVLRGGFFHDGTYSSFRRRRHGRPLDPQTAAWRLIVCAANHDQIGNRAAGDRLRARADEGTLALAALVTFTAPFTPLVFMGEEWGAGTPWPFFSSHPEPDLARSVSEGRRAEFARMAWDSAVVPDPQDPATYESAHLDWSEPGREPYAGLLDLTRRLIALRRSRADLTDPRLSQTRVRHEPGSRQLVMLRGDATAVAINLAGEAARVDVAGRVLLGTGDVRPGSGDLWLGARSGAVLDLGGGATTVGSTSVGRPG